jgi:cell shape-determining protein MreC
MPAFLFIFILLPVLLFLFISLLFLPFRFAIYSLLNIFTIPVLLVKIVINPKLRANHALEHATINVMEENFAYFSKDGIYQPGNTPVAITVC